MAWKSGSLTMPADAGGPRAGGCRLQMPNIMRVAVPGGEAIAFVGDASLTIAGGATATIPGGVFATLPGGSPALAVTTTYYVTYVLASAPSVLLACAQQDFAAIYAAADVVAIGYHTEHYDIRYGLGASVAGRGPGNHTIAGSDGRERVDSLWLANGSFRVGGSDGTERADSLWVGAAAHTVAGSDGGERVDSLWS